MVIDGLNHLRGPAGDTPAAAEGTALTDGLAGAEEVPVALISPVLDWALMPGPGRGEGGGH